MPECRASVSVEIKEAQVRIGCGQATVVSGSRIFKVRYWNPVVFSDREFRRPSHRCQWRRQDHTIAVTISVSGGRRSYRAVVAECLAIDDAHLCRDFKYSVVIRIDCFHDRCGDRQ